MSNGRRAEGIPYGQGDLPSELTPEEAASRMQMAEIAEDYDQWCRFLAHVRPVAVTTRVRISSAQVGGKALPHVEVTVALPTGPVVFFLPPAVASELAAQIDRAATGARTGLDPFARGLEIPR